MCYTSHVRSRLKTSFAGEPKHMKPKFNKNCVHCAEQGSMCGDCAKVDGGSTEASSGMPLSLARNLHASVSLLDALRLIGIKPKFNSRDEVCEILEIKPAISIEEWNRRSLARAD